MKQKLLIGGLGGITPLVAGVLVLDAPVLDAYVQKLFIPTARGELYLFGYALKGLLVFGIGMFWAYLHRSERNLLKIYQLGIVAPAIIVGLIDTTELRKHKKPRIEYRETTSDRQIDQLKSPKSDGQGFLERFAPIRSAQAACPQGTCPSSGGGCSKRACGPSWLDRIRDGFLSRPPPFDASCRGIPVSAVVPYDMMVTVVEDQTKQWCEISVEAGSGHRVVCEKWDGAVVVDPAFAVSRTETDEYCQFEIHQNSRWAP